METTLKKPASKGKAFLDVFDNCPPRTDHFDMWWMGQSGFLIKWQGRGLFFDPYLSDSLTEKYKGTPTPHVRMVEQVIEPEKLKHVQICTSTHTHTDHLDPATLHPLLETNPRMHLLVPEANIEHAEGVLGAQIPDLIGIDEGKVVQAAGFEFQAVAAAHNQVKKDAAGRNRFIGIIVKFADWTIYHSGDTLWHEGLVPELIKHNIDIALVPINGNDPKRKVPGNLNGMEAACLAKAIGASVAIPHHFDMFEFNTETPDEFKQSCDRIHQNYKILQVGEHVRSTSFPAPKPNTF